MNRSSSGPQQMPLDLAHRPAQGAEDFFLSQSNEMAVRLIDDWPYWAKYGQLLVGPVASGKSHLVNVWHLRADALIVKARNLAKDTLKEVSYRQPLCVEDIDRGLQSEETLFHLLNMVNEQGGQVLLTSRCNVASLDLKLQDLRSRLLALPSVSLEAPDDHLLKAVMIKQFADRQIEVGPQIIEYLFKRMERSMQAVSSMVDLLDRGSLGTGRAITKPLAREILAIKGDLTKPGD